MIAYIETQEEFDKIVSGVCLIPVLIFALTSYLSLQIAEAKEANKVVLVDYTAAWCGPCKMIAPILDKIAGAADSSKIEFYKVDVDDAHAVAQKAGVSSVCPYFLFLWYLIFVLIPPF